MVSPESNLLRGVSRPPAAVLILHGEDCFDFLQSQGTADLGPAREGSPRYNLWLDHKGLIHGDGVVWMSADERWWVVSEWTPAALLKEKFERHIIADDVQVTDQTHEWHLLTLNAWPEAVSGPENTDNTVFHTHASFIYRSPYNALKRFEVLLPVSEKAWADYEPISLTELEAERIQGAIPAMGRDIEAGLWNPFEAGLMHAVSLQKGCYLGQEVVARAHRLERRSKRFIRAVGDIPSLPDEGPVALSVDGVAVGALTSVSRKEGGPACAVGWLKCRIEDGEVSFDEGMRLCISTLGE